MRTPSIMSLSTAIPLLVVAGCETHNRQPIRLVPAEGAKLETEWVDVQHEVRAPGRYAWTNGMTAVDAIRIAGGATDFAKGGHVQIVHTDGRRERYTLQRIESTEGK